MPTLTGYIVEELDIEFITALPAPDAPSVTDALKARLAALNFQSSL